MLSIIKKTFGDPNERRLKKYWKIVDEINSLEVEMEKLSDDELNAKTTYFKEQLASGKTIEDIKVEAFAVVREAAKRVLGMRHFDVQLIGGLVLTDGDIAEMATGEGKTLVASLPSYLRALEGKGVHIITVNDYLAKRDYDQIGKIHQFLGLTVGLNIPMMSPVEKKQAYKADITYGIGTEFGFDYLRDNMAPEMQQKVQRPYHYAIIDEIDSVLIDEAKTPLIIAGKMQAKPNLYHIAARLAKRFKENIDYHFDLETKATSLTDEGIEHVEKAFGIDNLYDLDHQMLYHFVIQAVRAHVMFERDVDYIVKDGKVCLVDGFTGRIMEGRTLSDGLHQAIEAKEGLEITEENKTQASITIQNYFRMYPLLSGMTGTARSAENEFLQVYGMDVTSIPTNKPKIRNDLDDKVYTTKDEKYTAVLKEVKKRHEKGQPILIGTTSIIQSELVAKYLDKELLPYELLNAKTVEQEVELIAQAGQRGRITIATNMAGRGTDIILGEGVAELGGLCVIGTERHESRRVDNQLKGRSGRQGDPGISQFFISIEDDMFKRFASEEVEKLSKTFKTDESGLILNKNILEFVDRVQQTVEGAYFSMREYNLKLDDVINDQRNVVYHIRDKVLTENNRLEMIYPMIKKTADNLVQTYCMDELLPEEWNLQGLAAELNEVLVSPSISFEAGMFADPIDLNTYVNEALDQYMESLKAYEENNNIQRTLKQLLTFTLDRNWILHLENMNRLKEGIGLKQYKQEDPMRQYQDEGLELFHHMYDKFEKEASIGLAKILRSLTI